MELSKFYYGIFPVESGILDEDKNEPSALQRHLFLIGALILSAMNLESLAADLREFAGITRKKQIGDLIKYFPVSSDRIIASFGEDAAVIDDGDEVMLLAADGIWSMLMDADPEWAGYCAVLVNVHDIAAMGGWPVAMVDVLSVSSREIEDAVLLGMRKGIEKFNVPIIGGHLHPDTPYSALDVAILGKARKDSVILSSTARVGDVIVAAADMDGSVHQRFSINFDSTSFKDSRRLLTQLGSMRELGESRLVSAGKDISNPGLLGTLGMLLETSRVGAIVDVDSIIVPQGLDLLSWLKMYPGMGFVVTARPQNADAVLEVFSKRGLTPAVIGRTVEDRRLIIRSGKDQAVLFDLAKECVTGIR
jgi:putative methanogenesis marker protein 2